MNGEHISATTCNVSVVIPAYNQEKYIDSCIESVRNQTIKVKEIIVVDDGSTDSTPDKLAAYGESISLIKQQNGGASSARNRGVQEASCEWIMFLDSDDEIAPDAVETQLKYFAQTNLPFGFCNAQHIDEEGKIQYKRDSENKEELSIIDLPNIFDHMYPPTSGIMVKRELFISLGGFDDSLVTAEDTDLLLKAAQASNLQYIKSDLVIVRRCANGLSSTADTYQDEIFMLNRFFNNNTSFTAEYKDIRIRVLSRSYLRWADDLLYKGKSFQAFSKAILSMRLSPSKNGLMIILKSLTPNGIKHLLKGIR